MNANFIHWARPLIWLFATLAVTVLVALFTIDHWFTIGERNHGGDVERTQEEQAEVEARAKAAEEEAMKAAEEAWKATESGEETTR